MNKIEKNSCDRENRYIEVIIDNLNLEQKVSQILCKIGIPVHLTGYQYLRTAIIMVVENNEMISQITKNLYPRLAQKYNSTPSRIERAIRHAVEVTWNRGQIEFIQNIFGYTVDSNRGKPTNSEFIAIVADKIQLENKLKKGDNVW